MSISHQARYVLTTVCFVISLMGCGASNTDALNSAVSDVGSSSLDVAALSGVEATTTVTPFISSLSTSVTAPTSASVSSSSVDTMRPATQQAAAPLANSNTVTKTYTPGQIRAAYQLPPLPTSWSNLSAAQAAQLGAGQTIYIVNAMHDPNVALELSIFNQTFGLPRCTTTAIATAARLPLAAADPALGCTFSVVYSTGSSMTSTPPSYDSGWATEIALDVQWAHATAPLARIILIEAPDPSVSSLMGSVNLANAMGPGSVSMSFGAPEGSWINTVDSVFSGANMTYLAATGDSGAGVQWPSASAQVLAVGGTTLNSYTPTTRSESAWSLTGGGISQYIGLPSYQSSVVPGMGNPTRRHVADVSFNADPYTGQYVATLAPGTSAVQWYSVGGTSLSTPQWAGIVAVTNATRAQNGQGPLGLVQNFLYQAASNTSNFFTTVFNDIMSGNNGGYTAQTYYDLPSGLGSPNASRFITLASGQASPTAPAVTPITIQGIAGIPMAFSMAYTSPDPVVWSLSAAPTGMTVNTTGLVSWSTPVAGTYNVTVTALDTLTHLTGSAVAKIVVTQPLVPIVNAATVTGQTGQPLSYQVTAQSSNKVSYALSGVVPQGLSLSPSGLLTWASPSVGSYRVTVKAIDTVTSISASGVITLQISSAPTPTGPRITAPSVTANAGNPLSGVIGISDPGARFLTITIKGAPAGMSFSARGQDVLWSWRRPVTGTYTLVITARDNNGLSAQTSMTITIN